MVLRICLVIMFLGCIFAGVGWLNAKWGLETAQTVGEGLKTENEQYVSSLEEANRRVEIATEQLMLSNQQMELANASIGQLRAELAKAEQLGAYWWERAHPREFASVAELEAWLAEDDTDSVLYIFGSGCISNYDCDDYATALVYNALADGYLVSLQIKGNHMLNSTVIGNEIYYIEPQTDGVWLWGYRD